MLVENAMLIIGISLKNISFPPLSIENNMIKTNTKRITLETILASVICFLFIVWLVFEIIKMLVKVFILVYKIVERTADVKLKLILSKPSISKLPFIKNIAKIKTINPSIIGKINFVVLLIYLIPNDTMIVVIITVVIDM